MRIDKYLKNSRIIKRRSVAKKACEQGRVVINDRKVKPGDKVKVGDVIKIEFGTGTMKVEVLKVIDNPSKNKADELYKVL